jgi:hypothetical protein
LWHSLGVFETKTNLTTADAYLGVKNPVTLAESTHAFGSAIENQIKSVDHFAGRFDIDGGVLRFTTLHYANGAHGQVKTQKMPIS